jgi:hypothetical protein
MRPITASRADGASIGELSRLAGVNVETIRYYERIKILPAPRRTESGHRVYGPKEARILIFIRRGRELGFNSIRLERCLISVDRATPHVRTCAKSLNIQSRVVRVRGCRIVPCWIFLIFNTARRPAHRTLRGEVKRHSVVPSAPSRVCRSIR